MIEKRLIKVTPTTKHLTVPITSRHAPNVYVSVALVQGRMGDGPRGKPRMRMGLVNLPVRPDDNTLTVSVETERKDYRPGAAGDRDRQGHRRQRQAGGGRGVDHRRRRGRAVADRRTRRPTRCRRSTRRGASA